MTQQFKEFNAKSLDDAIREACGYFGVEREKLEIDIVSDAKTGIFGLVGAKKATIRARRHADPGSVLNEGKTKNKNSEAPVQLLSSKDDEGVAPLDKPRRPRTARAGAVPSKEKATDKPGEQKSSRNSTIQTAPAVDDEAWDDHCDSDVNGNVWEPQPLRREESPRRGQHRSAGRTSGVKGQDQEKSGRREASRNRQQTPAKKSRVDRSRPSEVGSSAFSDVPSVDGLREDLPEFNLTSANQEELKTRIKGIVSRLVTPIVGEVPCEVSIAKDRVRASLDCGDAAGLLVGREGQTLASVQYLATRILARDLGGAVRLQVDAGNYREKQDDRLKELAESLAERVKRSRRPQMTRPLSAYQRRMVHLALEGDPEVGTRSKGEGAQRRVMIFLLNKNDGASAHAKNHKESGAALFEEEGDACMANDASSLLIEDLEGDGTFVDQEGGASSK